MKKKAPSRAEPNTRRKHRAIKKRREPEQEEEEPSQAREHRRRKKTKPSTPPTPTPRHISEVFIIYTPILY
jgi:hypothetical protein